MKLQLDFDRKEISLESNVNLGEFFDKIEKILPDWRDYKLNTNVKIVWNSSPIHINRPWWERPWWSNPVYCSSGTTTARSLTSGTTISNTTGTLTGVHNVEV